MISDGADHEVGRATPSPRWRLPTGRSAVQPRARGCLGEDVSDATPRPDLFAVESSPSRLFSCTVQVQDRGRASAPPEAEHAAPHGPAYGSIRLDLVIFADFDLIIVDDDDISPDAVLAAVADPVVGVVTERKN